MPAGGGVHSINFGRALTLRRWGCHGRFRMVLRSRICAGFSIRRPRQPTRSTWSRTSREPTPPAAAQPTSEIGKPTESCQQAAFRPLDRPRRCSKPAASPLETRSESGGPIRLQSPPGQALQPRSSPLDSCSSAIGFCNISTESLRFVNFAPGEHRKRRLCSADWPEPYTVLVWTGGTVPVPQSYTSSSGARIR